MDPNVEPNQTGNDPDVTEHPHPWMPTWWANWLRKIRPWPWMPTVLAALILLLLYLLGRRRSQSS